jgi:NADPH:quinone reductase-like Zn-dependent oxidoreductase
VQQVATVRQGERVFIPAATGGVGSYAVQIARLAGAGRIVAGVGSAAKRDAALALGAHDVVVCDNTGWVEELRAITEGHGVDVALEATGGAHLERTLACLAPFGRLVVYGAASGMNGTLSPAALQRWLYAPALNQAVLAFNLGSWFQQRPQVAGEALHALIGAVLGGAIRLPTITRMRLDDAPHAHAMLESRAVMGKLVLTPWS